MSDGRLHIVDLESCPGECSSSQNSRTSSPTSTSSERPTMNREIPPIQARSSVGHDRANATDASSELSHTNTSGDTTAATDGAEQRASQRAGFHPAPAFNAQRSTIKDDLLSFENFSIFMDLRMWLFEIREYCQFLKRFYDESPAADNNHGPESKPKIVCEKLANAMDKLQESCDRIGHYPIVPVSKDHLKIPMMQQTLVQSQTLLTLQRTLLLNTGVEGQPSEGYLRLMSRPHFYRYLDAMVRFSKTFAERKVGSVIYLEIEGYKTTFIERKN